MFPPNHVGCRRPRAPSLGQYISSRVSCTAKVLWLEKWRGYRSVCRGSIRYPAAMTPLTRNPRAIADVLLGSVDSWVWRVSYPRCMSSSFSPLSYVCPLCFGPHYHYYTFSSFTAPSVDVLLARRLADAAPVRDLRAQRWGCGGAPAYGGRAERLGVDRKTAGKNLYNNFVGGGGDNVFFCYFFIWGEGCKWECVIFCLRDSLSLFQQLRQRVEREPPGPDAGGQSRRVLGFLFELMPPPAARLSGMGWV